MGRLTKLELSKLENRIKYLDRKLNKENPNRSERAKYLWELRAIEKKLRVSLVLYRLLEATEGSEPWAA